MTERVKLMTRELNLQLPETLFTHLEKKAEEQGVSLEALCFSLLSGQEQDSSLIDPSFYPSVQLDLLRKEVRKVIESDLNPEEARRRVNAIEFQISRRYIR
jgi:hypothetical protein